MFGIGGKKKPGGKGGPGGPMRVPTEEVSALSSRGFSEPEIVNALKKQGHSIPEIDEAMKGALKSAVSAPPRGGPLGGSNPFGGGPPAPVPKGNAFDPPPGLDLDHPRMETPGGQRNDPFASPQPMPGPADMPPMEPPMQQREPMTPPPRMPSSNFDVPTGGEFGASAPAPGNLHNITEPKPLPALEEPVREKKINKKQVEELVEVIIEEKWHEMKSKLKETDSKFLDLNNKIIALENMMRQMRSERTDELKQIETKIDTYKNSINDMNGKMQSMENAMRDSLTPLISTLRSLSETINNLKEKKGL